MSHPAPKGLAYFCHVYMPLDELLVMPRIRVMRLLRRCDWTTSNEIREALNVGEHDHAVYNTVLSRLVKDGHVDRRGKGVFHYLYRINAKGIANLKWWLSRSEPPADGSVFIPLPAL